MPWSATHLLPYALTRLETGMSYRLVLIIAPAGAGKTLLLRQWAAWRSRNGLRSPGFINLTPQDNTFSHFLPHLIAGVAGIDDELDRLISSATPLQEVTQSPHLTYAEIHLIDLINTLAQAPGEIALILDEYHWINALEIHQALSFLVEYLPMQVHIFLAARCTPPLRLARLRARRELLEITPDELFSDLGRI